MWPFKKKKQTGRRMFGGALVSRLTTDWITSTTSLDQELKASLAALRNRSKQLCRDNDLARNAKRLYQNNIVGTGIGFQSQVQMKRGGKLDKKTNDLIESKWAEWSKKENCHAAGKLCFTDIERHIVGEEFESGESLVRLVTQSMGNMKVPLALELIEPELLDENYNETQIAGGGQIRMGVEYNAWKRPVAYHFLAKHPGDNEQGGPGPFLRNANRRIRVPAEEIIHYFEGAQSRGVPRLFSSIMHLHHMHGYVEAEVIGARGAAAIMGVIETPEGEVPSDGVVDGDRVTDFSPGLVKGLAPGEKFNLVNPSRPGSQFDPFMRAMIRHVASGLGVSYESLSKDYSQSNYSSSRLALLDDRDNWKVMQWRLIRNFHQVVFNRWLELAVLSGELAIPDYEVNAQAYQYPRWKPRGWSWIDPAKEAQAAREAVRDGFITQADVIAERGGDIEELMTQRKSELDMAEELGLVFDTDPSNVDAKGAAKQEDAPKEPAATAKS